MLRRSDLRKLGLGFSSEPSGSPLLRAFRRSDPRTRLPCRGPSCPTMPSEPARRMRGPSRPSGNANLDAPIRFLGRCATRYSANALCVDGSRAFVTSEDPYPRGALQTISLSSSGRPLVTATHDCSGYGCLRLPRDVQAIGNRVYVADVCATPGDPSRLFLFDTGTYGEIYYLSSMVSTGNSEGVCVRRTESMKPAWPRASRSIRPNSASTTASRRPARRPSTSRCATRSRTWRAGTSSQTKAACTFFDVSDPESPATLSTTSLSSPARSLAVLELPAGRFVVLGAGLLLLVYDVTDPAAPAWVGTAQTPSAIRGVHASGRGPPPPPANSACTCSTSPRRISPARWRGSGRAGRRGACSWKGSGSCGRWAPRLRRLRSRRRSRKHRHPTPDPAGEPELSMRVARGSCAH